MKNKHLFTLGAGLALLTGCAVLTVDVDVYTGPLANTEEVQTEQVISLVMGAKPLLVQLRDHLEVSSRWPHALRSGRASDLVGHETRLQEELVNFRAEPWYWAGFVSPGDGKDQHLRNEHAQRVNDILLLYEDRIPEDLAALLGRGKEIYDRYQQNYDILFPSDNREERKAWAAIEAGILDKQSAAKGAYEVLLVSAKGHRVVEPLWNRLKDKHPFSLGGRQELDLAAVGAIRTNNLLWLEAIELFGPAELDDPPAKLFLRQCNRLLQAFEDCHAAWKDLTALAITGLNQVRELEQKKRFASGEFSAYVHRTVAGFTATLLTPPGPNSAEEKLALEARLLSTNSLSPDKLIARAVTVPPPSLRQARLPGELKEELSYMMRAADSALNGGRLPQGMETLIEDYLAAATNANSRSFAARTQLPEFTRLMDALVAFGHKVVTLGNTQVLLERVDGGDVKKYVSVLQYVGNAIVVHTDELKRLAAHQRNQRNRRPTTAAALRDSGLGKQLPASWDAEAAKFKFTAQDAIERVTFALRAEYIAALYQGTGTDPAKTRQALEAARSFRDQAQHAKNLADAEVAQAGDAAKKQAAEAKLAALRAHLEASLKLLAQAEAAHTLASGRTGNSSAVQPGSHANHIQQAIQAVTVLREGNIYLRPASAYLRSSYPATTLNLNESVGWGNQLERQAWRSVPVIGELLDAGGRARVKELRELDKQSWQNINRIRLHGAGNANYAVTKDDIGNWYVKSYSADPSDVIRGARNMALMSAGSTFGGKLPIIGKDGKALLATNSPLHLQYEKALALHLAATTNTWQSLAEAVKSGSFITNAMSAWAANTTITETEITSLTAAATANTLTGKLTEAVNKATTAVNATTSHSAEEQVRMAEAQILAVLQAVKTYHASVMPGIAKAVDAADRAEAGQAFTGKIREFLQGVVQDRHRALDRFESTVQVIQSGTDN